MKEEEIQLLKFFEYKSELTCEEIDRKQMEIISEINNSLFEIGRLLK